VKWQNEVRAAVGQDNLGVVFGLLPLLVTTALLFSALIMFGRLVHSIARRLRRSLDKHVPPRVSMSVAAAASVFLVYLFVSGVLLQAFYGAVNSFYGARDGRVPDGIVQPVSEFKSGSSGSYIPWEKIGWQGRNFVGSGPDAQEISAYSGQQALEPIRAYAGLSSADTAEERATLAVAELKRTKAFEREVLVVATATGTGWLDPKVVDSIEYMYQGDTAIVSQQYSYLPSWISFLVDQERAREAGRVLYDAVIDEWAKLPEQSRPKLIVYGLSLGSFGGQEAFSGINDIRRSVDAALFTGSPNESDVWRKTTDNRDSGSPEWQPVYRNGEAVRFASTREDILKNQQNWTDETRILFMQNANDPVVWFSFDLLFNEPDWLTETRGRGVAQSTRWYPIVTFLQVGLDQAIAESAPIGHGHYYIDTVVHAWAAVLPPEGWSVEKSDKLQDYINVRFAK
jgi:uncharacterized membrane protein